MSTINSEKFGRICDGVWRDRAAILSGRGILSGEAALLRAVYWRLCKAGVAQGQSMEDCDEEQMLSVYQHLVGSMLKQNAHPPFDGAPHLKELVRRSIDEGRGEHHNTRAVRSVASV
jgi:hypothetical protein